MHFASHQEYNEMLQLLKEASRRGVQVRILIDSDDPIEKMVQS